MLDVPQLVLDEPAVLQRRAEGVERRGEVAEAAAGVAGQLPVAPVAQRQVLVVADPTSRPPDDVRA
ncbi:MAG: hypothetical protein M3P93_06465 [Actinomycetota bacterium]|nr:hypothetical protein [Actinomycetota bacterium]